MSSMMRAASARALAAASHHLTHPLRAHRKYELHDARGVGARARRSLGRGAALDGAQEEAGALEARGLARCRLSASYTSSRHSDDSSAI